MGNRALCDLVDDIENTRARIARCSFVFCHDCTGTWFVRIDSVKTLVAGLFRLAAVGCFMATGLLKERDLRRAR